MNENPERRADTQTDPSGGHVPRIGPPLVYDASALLMRLVPLAWVALGFFLLDRVSVLLADYWLFQSLGLEEIFWTNFRTGAVLFAVAFLVGFAGIAAAGLTNPVSRRARGFALHAGLMLGLLGGYFLSLRYADYLLTMGGTGFGETDPVFGRDLGFYVFTLPSVWTTITWALSAVGAGLVFAIVYSYLGRRDEQSGDTRRLWRAIGHASSPLTLVAFALFALVAAVAVWFSRYDVLLRDNSASAVFTGATYVDVTGLFSTVNYYSLTSFVIVGAALGITYILAQNRRAIRGTASTGWGRKVRVAGVIVVALVTADFSFRVGILVRETVAVSPNEPVIQLEYIERHIDATRAAYDLDHLETVRFVPNAPGDPMEPVDSLLASPTLMNAPLWPGFVSRLERLIDPQHAQRILQTTGDPIVYAPTLEIFRQQQQLRTYYDFLDLDPVRYVLDGDIHMFASAVREIPLVEPKPWLAWWGQQFMLFTHGHGLVLAPVGGVTSQGEPSYAVRDIPGQSQRPELDLDNPSVYYGEGAGSLAYSNVRRMKEFDFPTEEGRAEMVLPADAKAGVPINSLLKRLVFGWQSRQFLDILFSRLIGDETRVHYYRMPLDRVRRIAPFLYLDSDPWAVAVDGGITWIVNGITTTDRYPYSFLDWIGDKSDERAPNPTDWVRVNYARDAVKITVDAYSGELRFYKFADEPILDTWARIYPDLFHTREEIPPQVREHLQYPVHLFHLRFDNIYNIYHMKDPMTFFNMEDMWDDSDEVLGPMLDEGKAITFSIEPYHWVARTGSPLPRASGRRAQFVVSMVFTPENALNLRAIPVMYMDGDEYGRTIVLQVPKGHYSIGPEQADAAIDQTPEISRQFDWWNRQGMDVIRGHTTTLVLDREVLFVEPIFLRSRQNPVTQLKQVCVVFRGSAAMAPTLEEALRKAVASRGQAGESGEPPEFLK
ncbi:MAG: UPF0182 family protein [Gemmatimonadetes bacterium]|nr:UPF0182 family protein [Gemmatimonadota bacterium]